VGRVTHTEDPVATGAGRSATVRALATRRSGDRGSLLEVLHDVMDALGHIAEQDVVDVADVLNLSVAEVHGVVGFYHDFRRTPAPAHTLTLCRAEACQAVGAHELVDRARQRFAGHPDVEVREVFCLGNCALGPSAVVDGVLRGRVDEPVLDQLAQRWSR
jgi:formate dehydrogenase subunit gamma